MKKKTFLIWILTIADFVLLFLMVAYGIDLISEIVGPDIIVYEDPFGQLDDPTVYRFGAGCWEYTVFLVKFIIFTFIQLKLAKKHSFRKAFVNIAIILHLLILVAGILYTYRFGNGYDIFLLIEHLFNPEAALV